MKQTKKKDAENHLETCLLVTPVESNRSSKLEPTTFTLLRPISKPHDISAERCELESGSNEITRIITL